MGSFALTCTISDLPIHAGTPVRFLLLSQNPYDDSIRCHSHSTWVPRTFPLRAEYSDYGSVENVQEGIERDLWMEGFQHDLIEVGVGDNSCHDVPATKDMGFDHLLTALWERRVRVQCKDRGRRTVADGHPTLQTVSTTLRDAGFTVNAGDRSAGTGYLVDERYLGSVRVRWASYGGSDEHVAALQLLRPVLQAYWVEIIPGSGSYAAPVELVVRPTIDGPIPDTQAEDLVPIPPLGLRVESAMIREDVWQALLRQPVMRGWTQQRATFQEYVDHAHLYWNKTVEHTRRRIHLEHGTHVLEEVWPKILNHLAFDSDSDDGDEVGRGTDPIAGYCGREMVPYGFGLTGHWRLMVERYVDGSASDGVVEAFLRTVAETAWVNDALGSVRYWWRPSYSVGPQYGEWKHHEQLHRALATIAKQERARERE